MAQKGILYDKNGEYHPQTDTDAVLNPSGTTLESRLSAEEQAVRGKGAKANANEYPFRFIGDFTSIGQLNTALDTAFTKADDNQNNVNASEWQGLLRARLNGQAIFVQQMAISFLRGDWVQVVTGMVEPSSNGLSLVTSDNPGIYWRSRDSHGERIVLKTWRSLQTMQLKTVNNQSLIGSGNIDITGSGSTIPIDTNLDESSDNAIANSAVAVAVADLQDAINAIDTDVEGGVIVCQQWADSSPSTAGNSDDYAYDTSDNTLYKYTSGAWVEQEGHPKKGTLYVNTVDKVICYWNEALLVPQMEELLSESSSGAADQVRFVNVWADGSDTPASWSSGWKWDSAEGLLKKKGAGGLITGIESPNTEMLYVDRQHNKLWRWSGTRMEELAPCQGGGGLNVQIDQHITDIHSKGVPTSEALVEYFSNNSSFAPESAVSGWGEPDFDDPKRPEYYLTVNNQRVRESAELKAAVKWGINFYDWPLRCYSGNVSGITALTTGAEDIEVFAPSERIYKKYNMEIPYTTADVFFNADNGENGFVLKVNTGTEENPSYTYYSKWKNSNEWNVRGGTDPRTDCVYSNIAITNVSSGKAVRNSYVWGWEGASQMTEIYGLMDDFTYAIRDCLNANNGSLILSNRIYYFNHGLISSLENREGFTIDGGNGVLFIQSRQDGTPSTFSNSQTLDFSNCKNGVIKNLTMRTIRDNDNSAAGSHHAFSSSDSGRWAFNFDNGSGLTKNILLKNIDTKGFNHDLHLYNDIEDITIDGWRSRDVGMNSFRGKNITIRNADWEQRKYPGAGMHIIYGQTTLEGVTIEDSHFRQSSPYTSVMIGMHETERYNWNMVFRRCVLEGNRIYFGLREVVTFEDCTLRQIWDKMFIHGSVDGGSLVTNTYLIQAYKSYYKFTNCLVRVKTGSFMDQFESNADSDNWVHIKNSDIYTDEVASTYGMIEGAAGNVKSITVENVRTNFLKYTYAAEYNLPSDVAVAEVGTTVAQMSETVLAVDTKVTDLREQVYGSGEIIDYDTVVTPDQLPKDASLSDVYYCTTNSNLYTCTEGSVLGRVVLLLIFKPALVDETKTTTFSLCLGGDEDIDIELEITTSDTLETISDKITAILEGDEYKYVKRSWGATNNGTAGNISYSSVTNGDNGSQRYLSITAKTPGAGTTSKSSTTVINEDSVTGDPADYFTVKVWTYSPNGSSWRAGKVAVWDDGVELEGTGLIEKVFADSARIDEVEAKLTTAGTTSNRPTDVEVGYCYFDTSLGSGTPPKGKPIWASKIVESTDAQTGEVTRTVTWVDATGTSV